MKTSSIHLRLLRLLHEPRRGAGIALLAGVALLALNGCGGEPSGSKPKSASPTAGPASAGAAADSPAAVPATAAQTAAGSTAASPQPATPARRAPAAPSSAQLEKWNLSSEPPLQLLSCADDFGDSFVWCLAVAPDGKRFVLGGARLTVWNAAESQPSLDLIADREEPEVKRPIHCVSISPDGELLAAGDDGGTLRLWNLNDHSERKAFRAHDGRLSQLAISPDSKRLATTSYSGEVRVWQSADGSKVKSLKVDDQEVARLAFVSDTLLATAGRETAVWNVESGEKVATLTTGHVIGPALAISPDRHWLAFADSDGHTKLWDVEKQAAGGPVLYGAAGSWIDFSPDGKRVATSSGDSTIRIWNLSPASVVQVINADGGHTTALRWLPDGQSLAVASERGRFRIWGTPESARSLGLEPIRQPELRPIAESERKSYSPEQFDRIIDVRSFPKLPNAIPGFNFAGMQTYNAPASQAEAELFYRYLLGKAGWTDADADPASPGLNFRKEGCSLNVSLGPADETPIPGREIRKGDLQISLRFAGNYDARWLPKVSETPSKGSFSSFSLVAYRTRAPLTDVEVSLLKKFHEAGWTAYTRLAAAGTEDPDSRTLSLLQGGSELTLSIGPQADAPGELVVQTSISVTEKSLPIPPDSGWIEFDNSTDMQLVASTKMDLQQTIDFYDREMALDGWLARAAGRRHDEKERKAWLSYIRGQQDVLIRLVGLPEDKTRVIVGDAERSSWQLAVSRPAEPATEQAGIEAADFELPKGAAAVKYEIDQKHIQYEVAGASPPQLAELFVKQMESLEWKRDSAGVNSDEYVLVTFKKGKAEIQLRARQAAKKSSAMISGKGLLWTKPLPTAPVRISYETWLRRNRKSASLEHLAEFVEAMRQITP